MITREEAKMVMDELFDQQDQLRQYIKSLEAQLVNTQQLTCEGCIYDTDDGCMLYPVGLCCTRFDMIDRYEPKDTK